MTNEEMQAEIRMFCGLSKRKTARDTMPVGVKIERIVLGELFYKTGLNYGVELGVNRGTYSKFLCETHPDLQLTCIDKWHSDDPKPKRQKRQDEKYERAVKKLKPWNVKFIRKHSMDALSDFADNALDFIYIDAGHDFDNVMPDIIFWSKKVRPGGMIACHDYFALTGGGVVKAVDSYTFCHNIHPYYVTRELFPTAFWVKP